jgi:hypothetical protein
MTVTTVNIDDVNWSKQVTMHRLNGFRVGGLLSLAVLYKTIDSEKLNAIFRQISIIPDKPRSYFLNGYLGWKFTYSAKLTKITTASTEKVISGKKYFERLFAPLDHNTLQILLPYVDDACFEQMMQVSNLDLFSRCWKAIRKLADTTLRDAVYDHLRTKRTGIKKALRVASNADLRKWLSGKLTTPLFNAPAEQVNHGDTEFEVLKHISSRVLPKDLHRIWTIMQQVREKPSLQTDDSLGFAILEGLRLRPDSQTESLCELRRSIESVVCAKRYFTVDKMDIELPGLSELRYEFFAHDPFENWVSRAKGEVS